MSSKPTVAVLGARRNPGKYSHKSVLAHLKHGYDVYPVNPLAETIGGMRAYSSLGEIPIDQVERITVYLPPEIGIGMLDQIAAKLPREVWFNPGSADEVLMKRAEEMGLPAINACSLIDLDVRDE